MNQPAHKTEGVNRTRTMRFYHSFHRKERDEETGYSYFGARYMDHALLTGWLSVDPMADKYPSLSPYNYCMWNPIKLVDPDGREIDPACLDDWNSKKSAIQNKKDELVAQRNELSNKRSIFGSYSRNRKVHKLNERIKSIHPLNG